MSLPSLLEIQTAIEQSYQAGVLWQTRDSGGLVLPVVMLGLLSLGVGLRVLILPQAPHRLGTVVVSALSLCASLTLGWAAFGKPVSGPAVATLMAAEAYLDDKPRNTAPSLASVVDARHRIEAAYQRSKRIQRELHLMAGTRITEAPADLAQLKLFQAAQ